MAVSEYHLDTRIRRRHIPLVSQQRRLRHLRSISARNISHTAEICHDLALVFTLHQKTDSPAFYTSEQIGDSLNPSWKDFESSNFPENVDTASPYVYVKVWNVMEEKELLIEWVVFFSGLVFLGEQVPKEGKNFKCNTLIFGMSEGYYGCNDSYQHSVGNDGFVKDTLEADFIGLRKSYTLSTLSRIKTVERAIKQTQATAQRKRNSINNKLQLGQEMHNMHAQRELLKIKISVLKTKLKFQEKNVHSLEKEISSSKEDLTKKRYEIEEKEKEQLKLTEKLMQVSKCHNEFRENLLKTEAQLNFRRKQLISELSCIYPIVEFPDRNGFSIHQVHLPNSESFSGHDETMIAIALGYVCHIVLMISQFLNVPLRYSVQFYGSRSSITDHISSSLPDKTREFPLYSKGKDKRCFEYGVFLLNKNIAQLRIISGLNTRDLSATLPNLYSLIELRLSVNSDSHNVMLNTGGVLHKGRGIELKGPPQTDKPAQNGLTRFTDRVPDVVSPLAIKFSTSEIEFLKMEVEAMMPNATVSSHNKLQLPVKNKDSSNALSCSLDKGLNEIKMFEKSLETLKTEDKQVSTKSSTQMKQLKETYHHSSYPNLISSLQVTEVFSLNSVDSSLPPTKLLTAESSRTNSEDEQPEEEFKQRGRMGVLNDSIFYIPSMPATDVSQLRDSHSATQKKDVIDRVVNDDFTADLSLRTEQLANRKSSFQMQRLRSSSADEEHLPYV